MGNESADCFRCIVLDSMNIMKKHFIMKHISFMMGKKVLAAVLLLLSGGTGAFAQEWIDVTSAYIKNADYSEGNTGWSLQNVTTDTSNRNAEIYEKTGSSTQQISGLPSGTYKLTVRGYYRDGDFASAENAHQNETEDIQAYLFAGDNQKVFVSVFSAAPHESEIKTNNNSWYKGYPNSRTTMRQFCDAYPTAYVNELEFTVSEDNSSVSVGVRVDKSGSRIWTCWTEFKLYIESSAAYDAFSSMLTKFTDISSQLREMGATAAAEELDGLSETYKEYTEDTPGEVLQAAISVLNKSINATTGTVELCETLNASLASAESLLADCGEEGKYSGYAQCTQDISQLETLIATAKSQLSTIAVADLQTKIPELTESVNAEIDALHTRISFNYSLLNVKGLADKIGGLTENEAYKKVEADLNTVDLTYETMKADVAALNAACLSAMTPAFLAKASEEQPIDMTSFIVNPNIYQNNANTGTYLAPDGWNCDVAGSKDNHFPTTGAETDTDLYCYSWSGNADNTIGKGWYYQQIGGTDGAVNLPDGMYVLKAATYSTGGGNAAYLYASVDNTAEQMVKSNINTDGAVYDAARTNLETTTTTGVVEVKNGVLYIGMKGRCIDEGGYVGGTGRQWNADNFRLYYVGAIETTVNLTMKVDWATLMLPFDAELQEGMTAYSCASVAEDGMLNLVKVEDGLKANVPYIINAATGSEFEFTGISCAEAETYKVGLLTGVHNETEAPVASYVLQNQESDGLAFYRVAENKQPKVGANRAYLTLPETLGANVRVVYFPTDTDGVTDVEAADVMVDVYTLDGICVRSQVKKSEALKGLKGIYILKNVK